MLEQGTIRFNNSLFVQNLFFRKIGSNISNMKQCIEERLNRYKQNKMHMQRVGAGRVKTFEVMDKQTVMERLRQKTCDVVSVHQSIVAADAKTERVSNDPSLMIDVKMEMQNKLITKYISCVEILLFSRLSASIWDDSVLITWENL